jgi:hypothetical protein
VAQLREWAELVAQRGDLRVDSDQCRILDPVQNYGAHKSSLGVDDVAEGQRHWEVPFPAESVVDLENWERFLGNVVNETDRIL